MSSRLPRHRKTTSSAPPMSAHEKSPSALISTRTPEATSFVLLAIVAVLVFVALI